MSKVTDKVVVDAGNDIEKIKAELDESTRSSIEKYPRAAKLTWKNVNYTVRVKD